MIKSRFLYASITSLSTSRCFFEKSSETYSDILMWHLVRLIKRELDSLQSELLWTPLWSRGWKKIAKWELHREFYHNSKTWEETTTESQEKTFCSSWKLAIFLTRWLEVLWTTNNSRKPSFHICVMHKLMRGRHMIMIQ